jgi:hypothetical protein
VLRVQVRRSVGERRHDHGHRPGDRPPAALWIEPGEDADSDEPEDDPREAEPPDALARVEPNREHGDEDRHRRVRDRGHARVDVLLTPRDQGERKGHVRDAQDERARARAADFGHGSPETEAKGEERHEHRGREEEAQLHHRRRLDLVHRDLDEEVGRAPDAGHDQEQGHVAADHLRTLTISVRLER